MVEAKPGDGREQRLSGLLQVGDVGVTGPEAPPVPGLGGEQLVAQDDLPTLDENPGHQSARADREAMAAGTPLVDEVPGEERVGVQAPIEAGVRVRGVEGTKGEVLEQGEVLGGQAGALEQGLEGAVEVLEVLLLAAPVVWRALLERAAVLRGARELAVLPPAGRVVGGEAVAGVEHVSRGQIKRMS